MSNPAHGADSEIPVVCSLCGTRMYVAAHQVGKQVRCPDCHSRTLIKQPAPAKSTSSEPTYSGDEYQLQSESDSASKAATFTYTKVVCRLCQTLMSVRIEHVGKRVKCPDCGAPNLIHAPAVQKSEFRMPDVSDVMLDAPPPPIETVQQHVADRLMANAFDQLAERESNEPQPTSPLETKLLHFVFRPRIIPFWLGLTAGLLVLWSMIDVINTLMQDLSLASILAVFMTIITAMVATLIAGIAIPQLLVITAFTSEGHDRIPYWPAHDLLERLRAILFAVNSLAMAALPGMLVATLLRPLGVPFWAGLLPMLVFFPFVILSMMEADSPFIPYASHVRASFSKHRSGWNLFYLQSCGLAAIFAFAAASAWQLSPATGRFVLVLCGSIYTVVYAHLLGRLAWIHGDPEIDEIERLNAELKSAR